MPILQFKNLALAYGDVALLDHIELTIEPGERIALIGRNGAGKSSLLKILAGLAKEDDGTISRAPNLSVALVMQEPQFLENQTVFDAVASGLGHVADDLIAYHALTHGAAGAGDEAALDELSVLQARLEAHDGWQLQSRVGHAVARLGIDEDATLGSLSGGLRKRVALARALVAAPDLLLLDEPTNHLDIEGITWLEETIAAYSGAVLVISHDRRFLETIATRIIELDRGLLVSYPGSFVDYQRRKTEALHAESMENARFDKVLKEEEVWIRQGVQARRTRNEGRVRRLEQLRRDRAARREQLGKVNFSLDAGERSGKLVAELVEVNKSYGTKQVIKKFDCIVQRGDRVGLVGPNGVGKSTLLKLILGDIDADAGKIKRGTQLQIAYFDQFREALDEESTLGDVISPGSEFVELPMGTKTVRKHVISYLGDFLFPPQRARAKVKSLSGGERNRLLLARLFSRPANLLVLDEPTNDLDMETLELLETLLQDYSGTVLLVSHDRTFLNNVVTQVFAFEGNGHVQAYAGGYDDWLQQRPSKVVGGEQGVSTAIKGDAAVAVPARAPARKAKMSFGEVRELESLPKKIEVLELEQTALQAQLSDASLYSKSPQLAASLGKRINEISIEIESIMSRWATLEAKSTGTTLG
ncbi:MAG: ATP-binding cassette domain-containing protein [Betaproteobacteria bacterium]